jgi:hypothetical protein
MVGSQIVRLDSEVLDLCWELRREELSKSCVGLDRGVMRDSHWNFDVQIIVTVLISVLGVGLRGEPRGN